MKVINKIGDRCKHCGKGKYHEVNFLDEVNGYLHCDHCKIQVNKKPKEN